MKHMFLFCLLCTQVYVQAQSLERSVISGGGGENFTIGETIITTEHGGNGMYLTQGFQQPDTVFAVVSVAELKTSLEVKAYPNPTTDRLFVDVVGWHEDILLEVYDLSGRKLIAEESNDSRAEISLEEYPAGNYLVCIVLKNTKQTIQIQKH